MGRPPWWPGAAAAVVRALVSLRPTAWPPHGAARFEPGPGPAPAAPAVAADRLLGRGGDAPPVST